MTGDDSDSDGVSEAIERLGEAFGRTPPQTLPRPDTLGERDRGFLTGSDREFLSGEWSTDSDYSSQVRSNRKATIRTRIANAVQDFPFLLTLDADQRSTIYRELGRSAVRNHLGALVAFIYLASGKDRELIEEAVTDGVYTAERGTVPADSEKGNVEDVATYIDIERAPAPAEIYARFQERGASALSAAEIGVLVQHGMFSERELAQLSKPEGSRRAEKLATEIEQAIEESPARTFEEWKALPDRAEGREDELAFPSEFSEVVELETTYEEIDIRDYLGEEYLASEARDEGEN